MLNLGRRQVELGARALGWTSIGIGLLEMCAPAEVQRMLGIRDRAAHRGILRVLGIRELAHGVGILAGNPRGERLKSAVWARVVGDVLDTAMLAVAARETKHPARFSGVASAVGGIGALDLLHAVKAR